MTNQNNALKLKIINYLQKKLEILASQKNEALNDFNKYLDNTPGLEKKLQTLKHYLKKYHSHKIICDLIKKSILGDYAAIQQLHEKSHKKNKASENLVVNYDENIIRYIEKCITTNLRDNVYKKDYYRSYYHHLLLSDCYSEASENIMNNILKEITEATNLSVKAGKLAEKYNRTVKRYNNLCPTDFGYHCEYPCQIINNNRLYKFLKSPYEYSKKLAQEDLKYLSGIHELKLSREKMDEFTYEASRTNTIKDLDLC